MDSTIEAGTIPENNVAAERQSLRSHVVTKSMPRHVITNQRLLTCLTRAAFFVTIATSGVIVGVSVWLMMDCRANFYKIRHLVPGDNHFCTKLGMPALFSCCIVLSTGLGLGCIGRRLTGFALIIISGVEVFQGALTFAFYRCTPSADTKIVAVINSSLLQCHVATDMEFQDSFSKSSLFAFPSTHAPAQRHHSLSLKNMKRSGFRSHIAKRQSQSPPLHHSVVASHHREIFLQEAKALSQLRATIRQGSQLVPQYIHGHSQTGASSLAEQQGGQEKKQRRDSASTIRGQKHNFQRMKDILRSQFTLDSPHPFSRNMACVLDNPYFQILSVYMDQRTLSTCVDVCAEYKAVCVSTSEQQGVSGGAFASARLNREVAAREKNSQSEARAMNMEAVTSRDSNTAAAHAHTHQDVTACTGLSKPTETAKTKDASQESLKSSDANPKDGITKRLSAEIFQCSQKVFQKINHLCHYDNDIILPLSLVAPLVYTLLSFCFMYLAYCDQRLKDNSNPVTIILTPTVRRRSLSSGSILRACRQKRSGRTRQGSNKSQSGQTETLPVTPDTSPTTRPRLASMGWFSSVFRNRRCDSPDSLSTLTPETNKRWSGVTTSLSNELFVMRKMQGESASGQTLNTLASDDLLTTP